MWGHANAKLPDMLPELSVTHLHTFATNFHIFPLTVVSRAVKHLCAHRGLACVCSSSSSRRSMFSQTTPICSVSHLRASFQPGHQERTRNNEHAAVCVLSGKLKEKPEYSKWVWKHNQCSCICMESSLNGLTMKHEHEKMPPYIL